MWGMQVQDADINFMWPNEETFADMTPDVKLQSL